MKVLPIEFKPTGAPINEDSIPFYEFKGAIQ